MILMLDHNDSLFSVHVSLPVPIKCLSIFIGVQLLCTVMFVGFYKRNEMARKYSRLFLCCCCWTFHYIVLNKKPFHRLLPEGRLLFNNKKKCNNEYELLVEGHHISGSLVMMINAMIDKDFFLILGRWLRRW